jgi:hypothetical protein
VGPRHSAVISLRISCSRKTFRDVSFSPRSCRCGTCYTLAVTECSAPICQAREPPEHCLQVQFSYKSQQANASYRDNGCLCENCAGNIHTLRGQSSLCRFRAAAREFQLRSPTYCLVQRKLQKAAKLYFNRNVLNYVRFEVFTAVTMKNVVFWDIKPQFIPHRRNITSSLQTPAS